MRDDTLSTRTRRIVGVSGLIAIVAFFLPWFSVCGSTESGANGIYRAVRGEGGPAGLC